MKKTCSIFSGQKTFRQIIAEIVGECFFPPNVMNFLLQRIKIEYRCSAFQILKSPRLTWDLETRHVILVQICTYLSAISCF